MEKEKQKNIMQEIEIEKIVLNCGGTGEKLDKSVRLLQEITNKKPKRIKSKKRIPSFGVRPDLETGCKVTLRGKEMIPLLKRLFLAGENSISKKKVEENHVSFGIEEYITIPEISYQREIGMLGLEVSIVFKRKGKRVKLKKIKRGKYPKRQGVTKQEIIHYLNKNFGVEVK